MTWHSRWRSLRHRRLQSILAVAALGTAVALPVVLLSVGGGVSQHELQHLQSSGYQVSVSAPGLHGIMDAHALSQKIDALPSVSVASPILSVPVDLFLGTRGAVPALAEGVIPNAFLRAVGSAEAPLFPSPLPLGDPTDLQHFANGTYAGLEARDVLISSPIAQNLGLTVGENVVVSASTNRSQGTAFQVTGGFGVPPSILGPTAAYVILLPLSDLQELTGLSVGPSGGVIDAADVIQVALSGSAATDPTQVARLSSEVSQLVPFYGVSSLIQEVSQLKAATGVLTGFYLALSSVALSVGLLFLTLVLVRRVETQRTSIGVERAIGVPGSQVAGEIATEALYLSVLGVVVGLVGGYLLVTTLARYTQGAVQQAASLAIFDPATLGLLALSVVALALLASLTATRSALRLSIPEALR